jgi:hypothetical protein
MEFQDQYVNILCSINIEKQKKKTAKMTAQRGARTRNLEISVVIKVSRSTLKIY